MKGLKLNDTIAAGEYKGKTVQEVIAGAREKPSRIIMSLLKKGLYFDDEVINAVGIKKTIRDVKFEHIVVDREKHEQKVLPKDRAKLSTILKDIHTIDNSIDNIEVNDDEEE